MLYAKVHKKEQIHKFLQPLLGLPEVEFPKDLSSKFKEQNYSFELDKFYANLGDVVIIEPHSSKCEVEEDYFVGVSGIDKDIFAGKLPGKGSIIQFFRPFKRILLEVIVKSDDNKDKKLRDFSKAVYNVVSTLKFD